MTAKTAAELAAQDPRLKAMLMELGSARLDEFPMEDGESGKRRHDSRISSTIPNSISDPSAVISRVPIKSAWAKAMQRGDFDDDDAAKVSGIDSMADGQLARARRHQAAASLTVHGTHDNFESNIRRDRNGLVPPHATAGTHGKRKVFRAVHFGNGPIDIERSLSSTNVDLRPHPVNDPSISLLSYGRGAFAGATSSLPSARPQPTVARPPTRTEQGTQPAAKSRIRLDLPDGASIILRLPADLVALDSGKTSQQGRGNVYLISGSESSQDMIILAIEDKKVPEMKHFTHFISQYDKHGNVGDVGLTLEFNSSDSGSDFYAVKFDDASGRESFIHALQGLVDRPKQSSQSAAVASTAKELNNADDTQKVANSTPEQRERKDRIARRLVELQVKKQSEAACASSQTVKGSRPIKDVPIDSKSATEEAHGARARKTSSLIATTTPCPTGTSSTTHLAPILKPEESEPGASRGIDAELRPFNLVEKHPIQEIDNLIQQKSLSPKVDRDVVEQVKPHVAQAASVPTQQTQFPFVVDSQIVDEMTEQAWDHIRYMHHSAPERFGFDRARDLIGASCSAAMGRIYPSFRKLRAEEQQRFIVDHAVVPVERGIWRKMIWNAPVMAERAGTDDDEARTTRPGEAVGAPAVASSKASGPIYDIEALMSMRSDAIAMIPQIRRLASTIGIPRSPHSPPKVTLAAQLQQAAAENSKWL